MLRAFSTLIRLYPKKLVFTKTERFVRISTRPSGISLTEQSALGRTRLFSTSLSMLKKHDYPALDEKDLEEDFVQGSGPGGQSVNRTMNCVVLKHLPTGLVIKCHETRSLETNRKRARERLQEKLDFHFHGDNSYKMTVKREEGEKMKDRKRKTKKKLEKLKAFKEREGLSSEQNEDS